MRNKTFNNDGDLHNMLGTAKKLKEEMDQRVENIHKENKAKEIEKLSFLEERYNMQIRRYENKIIENEKMMNEMSNLINNYEDQMNDYVQEIDKKQEVIEDLTKSRTRLDNMISQMESDIHKNRQSVSSQHHPPRQSNSPAISIAQNDVLNTEKKVEKEINKRDLIPRKELSELETHLNMHKSEIMRLQQENQDYTSKLTKIREDEEKLKKKITKYQ